MRNGRRITGLLVGSIVLTLAAALPVWGAVAPVQVPALRLSRTPSTWLARTSGEMIRGSQQRAGRARLVFRAAPDDARTDADQNRADARNSGPVPPSTAHRVLPRSAGAVVTQDDGPTRRRLSSVGITPTSSRPGRVAQARAQEITHIGAADVRDSIFHEAHAPPLSSFV